MKAGAKAAVQKLRRYVSGKVGEVLAMLYEELSGDENYSQFLTYLERYKVDLGKMTKLYDQIGEENNKLDRLWYLSQEDEELAGGDVIITPTVENEVAKEIGRIEEGLASAQRMVEMNPNSKSLPQIVEMIEGERERDEIRMRNLTKLSEMLGSIRDIEAQLDMMIAISFSRVMVLENRTGGTRNQMACFDELELGHAVMNMAKTNMIMDLGRFMEMLVKD